MVLVALMVASLPVVAAPLGGLWHRCQLWERCLAEVLIAKTGEGIGGANTAAVLTGIARRRLFLSILNQYYSRDGHQSGDHPPQHKRYYAPLNQPIALGAAIPAEIFQKIVRMCLNASRRI